MSKRTCGNCRWWVQDRIWAGRPVGQCRQNAAGLPEVYNTDFCGQWADATITPEQEERRELVRRFAVAIVSSGVSMGQAAWDMAEQLVDAKPGNFGREI